jgi:hypothetical protein
MRPIPVFLFAAILVGLTLVESAPGDEPIRIGSRLELLVDDSLIESLNGEAELKLHKPEPQEVVLVTGEPWEGNTCAYYTIFQDGDLYRMYYRGAHYDSESGEAAHREVTCYAESRDGIHWIKPDLGLFEFDGLKANNIVWDGIGTHCFTPFKDTRPGCPPEARYKAISRGRPRGKKGLYVFQSPDGIHWSLIHPEPVIIDGDFDSQNLAFWDPFRNCYVEYHRKSRDGKRDIMTATSEDFVHWTAPVFLEYPGAPREHLYTNAIQPYPRAPHVKIGFPTRFFPDSEQVEPTFMASRDGKTFHRWTEAVIPRTAPEDRDLNRSNYMTWGLVQLPGRPNEYSVYATEKYYTGRDSRVRRFTYRVDGFVSFHGGTASGGLRTKPLTFSDSRLVVNYRASSGGSLRVALLDPDGHPIEGFTLAECQPLVGDEVQQTVTWMTGHEVGALAHAPLRLYFQAKNADLFSFQFAE